MTSLRTDTATRLSLRNAIFAICGSRSPSRSCLDRIGAEAARVAGRARGWSGAWLYTLINLDHYEHHNKGRIKYGISPVLLSAMQQLARREALNGKAPISVYADRHVRPGSLILGRSHKCARRRCGVWFVSDTNRLYCSDECNHRVRLARRKRQAQARRQAELMRRRRGQRPRRRK
jgi:hypothetical protein